MAWDPKEIGRKGGAVGSAAQKAAARRNGAKGGRPRKRPGPNATRAERLAYAAQFLVSATEKYLEAAKIFPDPDPFTDRQLRAILLRKGRRDLWLRLKRLPRPYNGPPRTYEEYLEQMKRTGVTKPVSRERWESLHAAGSV